MKIKSLLFASFLFVTISTNAQDLAGRKIINGNLDFQFLSTPDFRNTTLTFNALYGKIKDNNTYLAFGLTGSAITNNVNSEINSYGFGPMLEKGKFIKIIEKFYLTPNFGAKIQGILGTEQILGFNTEVYANPIRIMYNFNNNILFTAGFGSAYLQASRINYITSIRLNGSLSNNSSFGVFYTFK
jgi:hypothetical protein